MSGPLIYDRGMRNSTQAYTDKALIKIILEKLTDQHVFINTTWISIDPDLENVVSKNKIAVCYSGSDWENTNDGPLRRDAHQYIKDNSKDVIHIGNTRGKHYFNWCSESVRRHQEGFFDQRYIANPEFDKVYMCLNRQPHTHRKFLFQALKSNALLDKGLVSFADELNIEENLDARLVRIGEQVSFGMNIKNDILSLGDVKNWSRCLINVVTETTVHTDFMITEKTWKPIIGMRPFLILGDQYVYPHLKQSGFDTFDDIFGTWWQDSNWQNRANSIVSILKSFDVKDCQSFYKDNESRLMHNRELFIKYMQENHEKIKTLEI